MNHTRACKVENPLKDLRVMKGKRSRARDREEKGNWGREVGQDGATVKHGNRKLIYEII